MNLICSCGHLMSLHQIRKEIGEPEIIFCVPECDCQAPIFTFSVMHDDAERQDISDMIAEHFGIVTNAHKMHTQPKP